MTSRQRKSWVSVRLAGLALLSCSVLLTCVATFDFAVGRNASDTFTSQREHRSASGGGDCCEGG